MRTDLKLIARAWPKNVAADLPNDINPILKRIYLGRGITTAAQTINSFDHLLPYDNLQGMQQAVTLLIDHIRQQKRILIVADYDADGATSCALAVRALRAFGAAHVEYLVPNRFEYGYGLTAKIVEVARSTSPDLIITVDNGIASIDGVAAAKQAGINVLITDHHLPAQSLPAADAIVNPNQTGDSFQSKHLAGVGVIFYVMLALRAGLRAAGWFEQQTIKEPNMAQFLDLVALGTVADVVKLDHNNRILVAQGLARIRAGRACAGIKALAKVSGRSETSLVSTDLGFCLGPRLNAAGRISDMSIGIECLLADDVSRAQQLAQQLDALNRERRKIENDMREQANRILERLQQGAQTDNKDVNSYCLFDETFHEGVIGIVAGRVKDKLHRPTIVFAKSDDGYIKGSARSIAGVHIRDVLDRIATMYPQVLSRFGGHAMAAGLTIRLSDLAHFSELFNQVVTEFADEDTFSQTIHYDGELAEEQLNLELAELLQNSGPWGQGFPEPVFSGVFTLLERRIVGENHLKMRLQCANQWIDAIAFHTTDHDWPPQVTRMRALYQLGVNEFNDVKSVQLQVLHITHLE